MSHTYMSHDTHTYDSCHTYFRVMDACHTHTYESHELGMSQIRTSHVSYQHTQTLPHTHPYPRTHTLSHTHTDTQTHTDTDTHTHSNNARTVRF